MATDKTMPEAFESQKAALRAADAIRRAFQTKHVPLKAVKGTTPRAKAMAAKRAAKNRPAS
jgi:hypothetical protein